MSTISVVKKDGYAAIAADSLTKWGPAKETAAYIVNHQKILQVGDSYLAIAGPTSAKFVLKHYFAGLKRKVRLSSADHIFEVWLALHEALKEHYFLHPEPEDEDEESYESSRMDVLIANAYGIFGVGPDRAIQEFSRFYAYGYGCEYALGAMFAAYEQAGQSAEDVARLGVQAAAEFDDSTGLPVTSYSVRLRA